MFLLFSTCLSQMLTNIGLSCTFLLFKKVEKYLMKVERKYKKIQIASEVKNTFLSMKNNLYYVRLSSLIEKKNKKRFFHY